MNTVTLIGTAFSVEVKYGNSGVAVAKLNISEYDGKEKGTDKAKYFSTQVVCFKELAELVGNSIQDKDSIVVVGRRSQESWEDKETGKKRYKNIVIADTVAKNIKQFANSGNGNVNQPAKGGYDVSSFGADVDDSDIPF